MISKSDIKYIQSLAHKKFRDESGEFVVEGVKMVDELLTENPGALQRLYASHLWVETNKEKVSKTTPLHEVELFELEKISSLTTPNEVLALVKKPDYSFSEINFSKPMLVLDGIQDPGNLGTIIRTCDWFGMEDLVCSSNTADLYNPKVIQASMGSIMRVRVHYLDLVSFLKDQKGKEIYAAGLHGKGVDSIQLKKSCILVIGNESKGIGSDIAPFVTSEITIPRFGKAESLNAAVAASILVSRVMF